jgi:hypothetical protein
MASHGAENNDIRPRVTICSVLFGFAPFAQGFT